MKHILCRIIGHNTIYRLSATFEYKGNGEYDNIVSRQWLECERCGKEIEQ